MYLKKILGIAAAAAVMYGSAATAEIVIGAGSGTGDPTTMPNVTIPLTFDCQAGESPEAAQWDTIFDSTVFSNVDTTNCLSDINAPMGESNFSTCTIVGLNDGVGVGDDAIRVALLFNPAANVCASTGMGGAVGTVEFTIDGMALPQTTPLVIDIEAIDGNPPSSTSDGSVTVEAPAGDGFYASNPEPGADLALGTAVVGQATTPAVNLNVENLSPDTDFDVTSIDQTAGPAGVLNTPAGATVPFGDNVDFPFSCTPSSRGDNSGSLTVTHDAANGADSPAPYDFSCTGLSPNVTVTGPAGTLMGSTADATGPTANITATNAQDGFTSIAENVTATAGAGDTEITVSGGPVDIDPDGGTDSFDFTVSCDNTVADTFSRDIDVTWSDPSVMGGVDSATVTVNCEITDVAPGYTSDPMPGSLLAFGQVENGDVSTAQTIDIGNEGSVGMGAGAQLEITGATLSDPVNYSFAPDPFTATLDADDPNGTASIAVTCNPQSIGDFSGQTVTVETNNGDQVYNLSCEGTSNAELVVTPASARDGVLNLGTVTPGTPASGGLTLSNAGTDPLDVDCTLTNANAGVIVFDPMPSFPVTLPPDASLTFTGTPPDVANYSELLECTATEPSPGRGTQPTATFTTEITVTGRPLVIPTMSRWGLVVMSLMLMLVAGFAGRRMMA